MEYGKLIQPVSFTTNVVDDTYIVFDNTASVVSGKQRLYDSKYIYTAKTNIYPLATYSWNHIDSTQNGTCIKLEDKTEVLSTAVPVIKDVTTVYVEDTHLDITNAVDGKYFIYVGNQNTLDFNTIDVTHPDWSESVNLRYWDVTPSDSSIYWVEDSVLNSKRHLDGVVFNQTILTTSSTIINEYVFDGSQVVNKILFFNIDLTSIKLTVLDNNDNVLIPEQIISLYDYQGIMTPYEWFFTPMPSTQLSSAIISIKPYSDMKIKIEYENTGSDPKIGETIFTYPQDCGKTLNRPQGRKKKFDRITIDSITGKKTRIKSDALVDEVTYNVSVPVGEIDSKITLWGQLINEDIVIIGDESGTYTNLVHFCYIQEFPYEIDTGSSENQYQIKLTTLA